MIKLKDIILEKLSPENLHLQRKIKLLVDKLAKYIKTSIPATTSRIVFTDVKVNNITTDLLVGALIVVTATQMVKSTDYALRISCLLALNHIKVISNRDNLIYYTYRPLSKNKNHQLKMIILLLSNLTVIYNTLTDNIDLILKYFIG